MNADSFIVHVKTDDIYKDITEDNETRFETRHCLKGKIEKYMN